MTEARQPTAFDTSSSPLPALLKVSEDRQREHDSETPEETSMSRASPRSLSRAETLTNTTNIVSWDDDDDCFTRKCTEEDVKHTKQHEPAVTSKSRNVVTSKASKHMTTETVACGGLDRDWSALKRGWNTTKKK